MRRLTLKGTGIAVSEAALGLSRLGLDVPVNESEAALDRFSEAGGNFVDTARVYSDWVAGECGRSERILGDYFRKRKNRDRFVVCTKGAHPQLDTMNVSRVTPQAIAADLHASLKALGTDYIDCYLLHRDDLRVPVEVLLDTLEGFRTVGKIRAYGVSNWTPGRLADAFAAAQNSGVRGFRVDQELVNFGSAHHNELADSTMQVWDCRHAEVISKNECAVMAYSGQASGFFHRFCAGTEVQQLNPFYRTPENLRRGERLQALARETGLSVTALLLLYLIQAKTLQIIPIVRCRRCQDVAVVIEALEHSAVPVDFGDLRDFE